METIIVQAQAYTENSNHFFEDVKGYIPSNASRFEVKITQDADEISQAKKLRINEQFKFQLSASKVKKELSLTRKLIDQHKRMSHDGYDSYAQHLIVKDRQTAKIIAYVRLIDGYTAFKIGGYFSETQFNVQKIFENQLYHIELSRLVIDKDYDNAQTAELLWTGITQYAIENGIDAIVGSLSIQLAENISETSQLINLYKANHMSNRKLRVYPYQLLPDNSPLLRFSLNSKIKSKTRQQTYLDYFFSKGIQICGEAHWNKTLNTAELFFHYKLKNIQQIPQCIQINEVELGSLCE
ncbi:GNAT family N-acetyltransferase [sulfur-oxidizing endosymbiont of Gigantopelta aegis]|uniref:GNAT family N-acetyltransferase n=1 Tax=sulfur-oxidizing endosymbiont of Gigantopelta aegis TaxID=2794934 RepID=UPI0018DE6CC4|nr:GNAT family N-acetyltransferase [sulfur-oxidizing endosymbiont of Gigantopelta aegis]